MAPVLGYWDIRGITEFIRYMLTYVGEEFEDKRYDFGPNYDYSPWLNEKYSLGLDFPNLPYYIDGDVKISQSLAIARYLARKHNLIPEDEAGKLQTDILEQQFNDMRWTLIRFVTKPDYLEFKDEFVKNVESLQQVSKYLGESDWFCGQKISYVDFLAYETLDYYRVLHGQILDDFKNLQDYMHRFEKLPAIEKYRKSDKYRNRIYWGGRHQEVPCADK